jgi:DNA-binding NtrC family response regulator
MTSFTIICDERMTRGPHVGGLDHKEANVSRSDNPRCGLSSDKTKPPYVLIIEDHEPLSRLLCEVFRYKGTRCFSIRSKTSAEHFLRQVRPDLVVLDYQLIGGVGLEAAQIASEKNVPVIVTSGNRNIVERVHQAGYFYLMKPFTIAALLDMASMALGQKLGSFEYPSSQLH